MSYVYYSSHLFALFTHSILHKHIFTYRHMPHKFRDAILTFFSLLPPYTHINCERCYQYLIQYQRNKVFLCMKMSFFLLWLTILKKLFQKLLIKYWERMFFFELFVVHKNIACEKRRKNTRKWPQLVGYTTAQCSFEWESVNPFMCTKMQKLNACGQRGWLPTTLMVCYTHISNGENVWMRVTYDTQCSHSLFHSLSWA